MNYTKQLSVILVTLLSGCADLVGHEQMVGFLGGTAVGSAVGAAYGEFVDGGEDVGKATAIGAAGGAALGFLAGGMMADENSEVVKQEARVIRKPAPGPSDEQRQIDALRRYMEDRAILGGLETKPWNERYLGEEPESPYQGPACGWPSLD